MTNRVHLFPKYDSYYRGYGLTERKDGTYSAINDTPDLHGQVDYPNIGLGWAVDNGRNYTLEQMQQRIDEVIAERDKRIGWVKEFAATCDKPERVESYLLSSCDPNNVEGHRGRSNHTEAELHHTWFDGTHYNMRWCFGYIAVAKTKHLYRQFLIEKGYITEEN